MRNVRRLPTHDQPVFLTQVCANRSQTLKGRERMLLAIVDELRAELEMKVYAHVILPDHFHLIVEAPTGFSRFMQSLKLRSVRRWRLGSIWQARFFDHVIRDEEDLHRHVDYIHHNQVKHGYSCEPGGYQWSSFRNYQKRGHYAIGWGQATPSGIADLELD